MQGGRPMNGLIWRARAWAALNRHWVWLAIAALIVVSGLGAAGAAKGIAVTIAALVVFLVAVYALTRFVKWAANND
jgi:hypothetical protein